MTVIASQGPATPVNVGLVSVTMPRLQTYTGHNPLKIKESAMASELIKHVSDASFEADVLQPGSAVLVDYWAEWGGPCQVRHSRHAHTDAVQGRPAGRHQGRRHEQGATDRVHRSATGLIRIHNPAPAHARGVVCFHDTTCSARHRPNSDPVNLPLFFLS